MRHVGRFGVRTDDGEADIRIEPSRPFGIQASVDSPAAPSAAHRRLRGWHQPVRRSMRSTTWSSAPSSKFRRLPACVRISRRAASHARTRASRLVPPSNADVATSARPASGLSVRAASTSARARPSRRTSASLSTGSALLTRAIIPGRRNRNTARGSSTGDSHRRRSPLAIGCSATQALAGAVPWTEVPAERRTR